jgi:hypothetical protein
MNEYTIINKDKVVDYIRSVVITLPVKYIKSIQEKMEYLEKYDYREHKFEEHIVNIGVYNVILFRNDCDEFSCWITD